jgi:hypothetical protein
MILSQVQAMATKLREANQLPEEVGPAAKAVLATDVASVSFDVTLDG